MNLDDAPVPGDGYAVATDHHTAPGSRRHLLLPVTIGAVTGLAWSAALRSYMAEINGGLSSVAWLGTFVGVLLPGVIVGGALAAATALGDRPTDRRPLRWIAASPLVFAIVPMLMPGALWQFLTTGIGGGPIAVALGAIAGGYALGGGRRLWARIVCGVVAVATVVAVAMSVAGIGGARLALTSPRGAWVTILVTSLVAVFMFATAIPFRKLAAGTSRDTRVSE